MLSNFSEGCAFVIVDACVLSCCGSAPLLHSPHTVSSCEQQLHHGGCCHWDPLHGLCPFWFKKFNTFEGDSFCVWWRCKSLAFSVSVRLQLKSSRWMIARKTNARNGMRPLAAMRWWWHGWMTRSITRGRWLRCFGGGIDGFHWRSLGNSQEVLPSSARNLGAASHIICQVLWEAWWLWRQRLETRVLWWDTSSEAWQRLRKRILWHNTRRDLWQQRLKHRSDSYSEGSEKEEKEKKVQGPVLWTYTSREFWQQRLRSWFESHIEGSEREGKEKKVQYQALWKGYITKAFATRALATRTKNVGRLHSESAKSKVQSPKSKVKSFFFEKSQKR